MFRITVAAQPYIKPFQKARYVSDELFALALYLSASRSRRVWPCHLVLRCTYSNTMLCFFVKLEIVDHLNSLLNVLRIGDRPLVIEVSQMSK